MQDIKTGDLVADESEEQERNESLDKSGGPLTRFGTNQIDMLNIV